MTEEEMMATVCHKTLVPIPASHVTVAVFSPRKCLGRACSAWRWEKLAGHSDDEWYFSEVSGYCGLAGPP